MILLNAVLVIVIAGAWTVWENRRRADEPDDPEYEEREVRFGMRLVGWIAVIAVLVVGLLLQSGGVGAGGWLALAAVAAMLLLYIVPWLGPRRQKRRGPGDADAGDVGP